MATTATTSVPSTQEAGLPAVVVGVEHGGLNPNSQEHLTSLAGLVNESGALGQVGVEVVVGPSVEKPATDLQERKSVVVGLPSAPSVSVTPQTVFSKPVLSQALVAGFSSDPASAIGYKDEALLFALTVADSK